MRVDPYYVDLSIESDSELIDLQVNEDDGSVNFDASEATVVERDYNKLDNKPSINNVVLQENITLQQLGLQHIYYGTKAEWNAQKTLVSEAGALYIYSDYSTIVVDGEIKNVPALKIGDGTSYLIDMPTTNGNIADMLLEHIQNAVVHVTADDKTFWNNKSSAYIDPNADQETLTLSNTSFMIGGIVYNHG